MTKGAADGLPVNSTFAGSGNCNAAERFMPNQQCAESGEDDRAPNTPPPLHNFATSRMKRQL